MNPPSSFNLNGRAALVTGASRGIGRAIALSLAANGASLAILARNLESLHFVTDEIRALGSKCIADAVDVSRESDLEKFIARAISEFGSIDILVNNAGVYATSGVEQQSMDEWRSVLEINLTAAAFASKCVLPAMISGEWGRIINISSISGKSGEPFGAAYSASKFALIGLTESLALEVARHGITVNAVCPGWVKTKMALDQLQDPTWCELNAIDEEQSVEIARLSVPQMRFIEPEEVADLVSFLCSESARGITGQAINICGGLSIH